MEVWKIIFLSKRVICRFHVNLPGCIGFQQNVWERYPRSSNCTTLWNWSREIFDTSLVADRKKDRIISIHVTFFWIFSEAITTKVQKRATRRHQLYVVILWVQELQKCQSSEHFPPWFQTQSLRGRSQTTTVTTGTSYRKCYARCRIDMEFPPWPGASGGNCAAAAVTEGLANHNLPGPYRAADLWMVRGFLLLLLLLLLSLLLSLMMMMMMMMNIGRYLPNDTNLYNYHMV